MTKLTLKNFDKEVLSSTRPCVILFKNEGCHLCHEIIPVMRHLEEEHIEFKFGFIDTFVEEELARIFDIGGVPTVFVFADGDSWEVDYPDSGYSEEYLTNCLGNFF
jgi:thioredoxin-like negative regulator of GroEL